MLFAVLSLKWHGYQEGGQAGLRSFSGMETDTNTPDQFIPSSSPYL